MYKKRKGYIVEVKVPRRQGDSETTQLTMPKAVAKTKDENPKGIRREVGGSGIGE